LKDVFGCMLMSMRHLSKATMTKILALKPCYIISCLNQN
jgi:hypothetical protein